MKPLEPLQLSAIITFGILGTMAMAAGLSWKERALLISENERLRWQVTHPVHIATSPNLGQSPNS